MSQQIINLGIVAHADAGKTTLTEQILYAAGAIRTPGSVDDGTASTDTMEIERRRGISIRAASASVLWNGVRLNLIDAPGHSDFLSEVERTLSVLDAAVLVISAVEGVQPQTRMLLEAFSKAKLPCVLFVNKCDRAGSDVQKALRQVERETGLPVVPFSFVQGEGEGEAVSVRSTDQEDPAWQESAVLSLHDDALLERLLAGSSKAGEISSALKEKLSKAQFYPALCGASKYGLGVKELLDALSALLSGASPKGGEFCARIYKVESDPALGKAAYARIFSGSIKNRQSVPFGKEEVKVTRLRGISGRNLQDIEQAVENEIVVLYGLSNARAGDLLGTPCPGLREYRLAEPLMLCRVLPQNPDDLPKLTEALSQLEDEDPALQVEWNREKQEIWLRLSGKMQIEVLEDLLQERFSLAVAFGEASVIYRETPVKPAEGFDAYTMPKPCWAVVRLLIEPLPQGSGVQFESKVSPGRLAYRYQTHIETAVPRALRQGPHGWPVTDVKLTLVDGESHHVHTHPLDFFVATPLAVADGLRNAGTKLLEPILKADFSGPEQYLGKAIGLLTERRGRFESPQINEGGFHLEALIPAAEAMDLPVEFAAATGGQGVYASRFSHYEDCPDGLGHDRARIGVDPLDRSKFILAARSALSAETDVR